MKTFRQRIAELVLEHPEQMVLEMAERILDVHGEFGKDATMELRDVAWIAAAFVVELGKRSRDVPRTFTITADDGVRFTDG